MTSILIYTKPYCPYCVRAKQLLKQLALEYSEIDVSFDTDKLQEMIQRSNRRTVPQIFINDVSIGGFDDMYKLYVDGELNQLITGKS